MKKLAIVMFLAIFAIGAQAQNRSIEFEKPNWKKAVAKAKKENKLIFVDCFTTWCGPCKQLAKDVFTKDEVADFHNQTFVNLKLDIENDEAGRMLEEKHGITGVPTLFWIDPNTEELVHRVVGGGKWESFLATSKQAADRNENLVGLIARYQEGDRSPEFMEKYLSTLRRTGVMDEQHDKAVMDYLRSMPDDQFFTEDVWGVVKTSVSDPLTPEFKRVMVNRDKFYEVLSPKEVDSYLSGTLFFGLYSCTTVSPYDRMEGKGLDKDKINEYLEYLYGIDYLEAPRYIMLTYLNVYDFENDPRAYFEALKDALKYNLLAKSKGGYVFNSFNLFQKIEDKALLQEVIDYLNELKTMPLHADVCETIDERMPMLTKRMGEL